ncbi:MAG: TRAP transporter small permease subunit [Cardiobacteriaceae bacterium]|nr:TRAP transporter small permease subunit [Cardiobacteriaceae bacterium]
MKILAAINRVLEIFVVMNLALMSFLIFLNVILRYTINSGLTFTEEASRYMFVWLTFMGTVLAFNGDEHVSVNFLIGKLPIRLRAWWTVFTDIVLLICCILILIGCSKLTIQNMSNLSPITGIPTGINFLAASIMSTLLSILIVVRIAIKINAVRRGYIA